MSKNLLYCHHNIQLFSVSPTRSMLLASTKFIQSLFIFTLFFLTDAEWVMLCLIKSLKRLQIKHLIRIEYHICFQLLSKTKVLQIEHYHCVSFFANSCLLGWSEITFSCFFKIWVFLMPGFVFAPYYPPTAVLGGSALNYFSDFYKKTHITFLKTLLNWSAKWCVEKKQTFLNFIIWYIAGKNVCKFSTFFS